MTKVRTFRYVPKCVTEEGKYQGFVVLKRLNYFERMELMKKFNVQIDAEGKVDVRKEQSLDLAIDLVKFSEPFYVEVDLTCIETGEKYMSFEDLTYEPRLTATLTEVAGVVMNGEQLGNG